MQKIVFSIIILVSYSLISIAIAVEPTSLPPTGKINPHEIKGKSNAIASDTGAGKVLKTNKSRYDLKKGVIEYPRDGGRVVK